MGKKTRGKTHGVPLKLTMMGRTLRVTGETAAENVPSKRAVGQLAEGSAFSPSNLEESLTMHARRTSRTRHGVRPELMAEEYLTSIPTIGENVAQDAL